MSPFGTSGELHVTTREVEVAVSRETAPTSAGAIKITTINITKKVVSMNSHHSER